MSGATEAADTLRAAALERYPALRDIVAVTARAVTAFREAGDIVLVMTAADNLAMAAADLKDAAEALHKSVDAALAKAMTDTGCFQVTAEHRTISLRQNPASVEIEDPSAVPQEYWTTPEPRPDKAKIRAAAKAGLEANWFTIVAGGLGLTRRANK